MPKEQIEKWFENYDKWVHQSERASRLGLAWEQYDNINKCTYTSLAELDLKAEEMRLLLKQKQEGQKQRIIEWRKARGLEV